jgi:hypothetical protein
MDASEKTKLDGTSNPKNEDIFPTAPGSIAIAKKPILITSQHATYFSYSFRCRTHQAPNNNADTRVAIKIRLFTSVLFHLVNSLLVEM